MQEQYSNSEYITTDLMEASYLKYLDFPCEFDRRDPGRIRFIFKGSTALIMSKVRDFCEGRTKVDAVKILTVNRELRVLIQGDRYQKGFYQNNKKNYDEGAGKGCSKINH